MRRPTPRRPTTVRSTPARSGAAEVRGSATFSTAGSFPYHCKIHPTMTGTVTVQATPRAAAVAAGQQTPPTDAVAPTTDSARDQGLVGALALATIAGLLGFVTARRRLAAR